MAEGMVWLPLKVSDLLRIATARLREAGIVTARLDAEVLLAFVLGCPKEALYTRPDRAVTPEELQSFEAVLDKRSSRVPVAYIRSKKEFMSLDFLVSPAVLIPRPETEVLVETVLSKFDPGEPALMADVGTGSGAIAVSLARFLPQSRVVATDISPSAISVARENAVRHGVSDRVQLEVGDFLEPLFRLGLPGRLDAVVSNPPYISTAEMKELPRELSYEPRIALDGGEDGLEAFRRIFGGAARLLSPSGFLALEVSSLRAREVGSLAQGLGYSVEIVRDYAGRERVVLVTLRR